MPEVSLLTPPPAEYWWLHSNLCCHQQRLECSHQSWLASGCWDVVHFSLEQDSSLLFLYLDNLPKQILLGIHPRSPPQTTCLTAFSYPLWAQVCIISAASLRTSLPSRFCRTEQSIQLQLAWIHCYFHPLHFCL